MPPLARAWAYVLERVHVPAPVRLTPLRQGCGHYWDGPLICPWGPCCIQLCCVAAPAPHGVLQKPTKLPSDDQLGLWLVCVLWELSWCLASIHMVACSAGTAAPHTRAHTVPLPTHQGPPAAWQDLWTACKTHPRADDARLPPPPPSLTPVVVCCFQGCHHWLPAWPLPGLLPLHLRAHSCLPGLRALLTAQPLPCLHQPRSNVSQSLCESGEPSDIDWVLG